MTIIYNAILLDEDMNKPGAIVVQGGKIKRVLFGKLTSTESAFKAAARSGLKGLGEAGTSIQKNNSRQKGIGAATFIDAMGLTLSPAFIDMHAHFRYPGQTQKEDLDSALAASSRGGFGTLVLMPNTNPVVSSKEEALKINSEAKARKKSQVFQAVSITKNFDGATTSHLAALSKKTTPVISEDGHDVLSAATMLEGMKIAAKKKIIVSCHCEDPTLAEKAKAHRARALALMKEHKIPAWGALEKTALEKISKTAINEIVQNLKEANSLLELAEDIATERNIRIAQKAGCHIHLCHVSTAKSIEAVRRAKAEQKNYKNGFCVTAEITPHHLGLEGTRVPEIFALVNPPLRTAKDRAALWAALKDGTADCIATDHAPHTEKDKAAGSPGFTGLETAYAFCNTVLCQGKILSAQKLSGLMSAHPAKILGLKKGLLKEGFDADFVLLNPKEKWKVSSKDFLSKGKATPLEGKILTGCVKAIMFGKDL